MQIVHAPRQANFCADWLAKYGSKRCSGWVEWRNARGELGAALLVNLLGLRFAISKSFSFVFLLTKKKTVIFKILKL